MEAADSNEIGWAMFRYRNMPQIPAEGIVTARYRPEKYRRSLNATKGHGE
jgi:hypothetical protein